MRRPRFDDRAFRRRLEEAAAGALEKAAVVMVGHVKLSLNVSARAAGGGPSATRARNARGRRRAFQRAARFVPSAPGEPPRKRTGWLQRFTAHEVTREGGGAVVARVGNGLKYARHLELGTRTMAPRPFLRPALAGFLPRFQAIAAAELRRRLSGR